MSIFNSLLLNSNFIVFIGTSTYSFSRIRNISESLEVESVSEGGDNLQVHSLLKQRSSEQKLVLERGVFFGTSGAMEKDLKPGAVVQNVQIMVLDHGIPKKAYYFDSGIITRWELSGLDAKDGQPLFRSIEITHSGLHESKLP